jgi:hypothetical protein
VKPPSIAPPPRVTPVAAAAPLAPGAATQSVAPHVPPRQANVAVGALPSVMVDDEPNATTSSTRAKTKRRWA